MINLNDFRKNIFQNEGVRECPHYSEDGVILKIFETIGTNSKPLIVEFGETRSLGTTTRSFRIRYKARAIYFTGDLNLRSTYLNILDILKVTYKKVDLSYLKFLTNMPFKFFVTPDNILNLFEKKKVNEIDLLTIDIDSYDYFIARKILENNFKPRLLILEYNFNLGMELSLSVPYVSSKVKPNNSRIFGASYKALNNLANQYGYTLVHVSGFCNLFYVRNEDAHFFETPDLSKEIIKSDAEVKIFAEKFCQKGFLPSWFTEKQLERTDLEYFVEV
jgi:hypothetical protein